MIQFWLALALFLALHSVPSIPAVRQGLVTRLGRRTYLALYSLVSLAALGWLFHAALQLEYVELWPPAAWQAWIAILLTPMGLFFLVTGLISPNPLSVTLRAHQPRPGAVVWITRHPVLWGFLLWASGHVVANGDLRSLLLFGGFALFAVFGMVIADRRTIRRADTELMQLFGTTSVLPFAAIALGRSRFGLDRAMLVGLVVAGVLTGWLLLGGHATIFGADPLAAAAI